MHPFSTPEVFRGERKGALGTNRLSKLFNSYPPRYHQKTCLSDDMRGKNINSIESLSAKVPII